MAEERRLTEDFAAAPGGAAPQSTDSTTDGNKVVDKPKDEGGDGNGDILNPPWYKRAYGRIRAAVSTVPQRTWLVVMIVIVALVIAALAYFIFAGNDEEKASEDKPAAEVSASSTEPGTDVAIEPVGDQPAATAAPAPTTLTSVDSTSAMVSAVDERLGKVEETLKSAPPTAASVPATGTATVDEAQWISQCVGFGGTAEGCKVRLEKLRVR